MPRRPFPRPAGPRGSVAVPFALILPVVLGMMGMAIDLSMLYLREAEMQQMADSVAMAAAHELNGTLAGVSEAKRLAAKMAENNYYGGIYSGSPTLFVDGASWSSSALFLSSAPSGAPWIQVDAVTDAATAADMMYVKVDTTQLDPNAGRVDTTLMRFLGAPKSFNVAPVAVAGKTGMQVTPIGICALNPVKYTPRPSSAGNELVEFGYRRGVPYDLLDLNPDGATPQNYLVNPIDDHNVASPDPAHTTHDYIKPFFCSGSIAFPTLRSNAIVHVATLPDIHEWLNSRFDDFAGAGDACPARDGAPPDKNIKEFAKGTTAWINADGPAATEYKTTNLVTMADPLTLPSGVKTSDYGPLWVYKKPVKFVSASAGGGTTPTEFKLADWPALYPTNSGAAMSAPYLMYKDPPYTRYVIAPSGTLAVTKRRVLNVPILDCSSVSGGTANVVGIGSFLMTAKATATSLPAEFDGLVAESTLVSNVRRFK